jgi:hypothetical protein
VFASIDYERRAPEDCDSLLLLSLTNSGEQILAISIYCESSDIDNKSFGTRANVYPGKAPLQGILEAEIAKEHMKKKPVDNIDQDTKTLGDEELESGGQTGGDGQLLVTGELPSLLFWPC